MTKRFDWTSLSRLWDAFFFVSCDVLARRSGYFEYPRFFFADQFSRGINEERIPETAREQHFEVVVIDKDGRMI